MSGLAKTCAAALSALFLAFALSGCGDGVVIDDSGLVMGMFDNRYRPDVLTVTVGDTVEFPNEGNVDHNVIDVDGTFDSRIERGGDHKPDETWAYTFTEPGTFNIYCSLHAVKNNNTGEWTGMVATITVEPGGQ